MFDRSSGVLLHITSLLSPHGIGSLGQAAYHFVDFLAETRQSYWQVLPLGHIGFGASPYQCFSAAAGNPYLIDLDFLAKDGLLTAEELEQADAMLPPSAIEAVPFETLAEVRMPLLRQAFSRLDAVGQQKVSAFAEANTDWLPDYALFMSLKAHFQNKPLWKWADVDAIRRTKTALSAYRTALADEIAFHTFLQATFFAQWTALRQYANAKGIRIIGDMPIYVAADSCDVWVHPQLFQLSADRSPRQVAGVPPDYFSKTGQLWGNPVYAWETHEKEEYAWWLWRIRSNLRLFDALRIDHFRGLESFWTVPADAENAIDGRWEAGPGRKLLRAIRQSLGKVPLIAEDLGVQTDAVRALLRDSGYPGMRVLIFGFSLGEDSEHLPHNYPPNSIVYTSTHDSQTVCEQIEDLCTPAEQAFALQYLAGKDTDSVGMRAVRSIFASPARTAMAAMQDVLSLGAQARMNHPSTIGGTNWRWRMRADAITDELKQQLRQLTQTYRRAAPMQILRPITHIIFDLDGTLLDTLGSLTNAVNFALCSHDYPERSLAEIRSFIGNGIRNLMHRALPDTASETAVEVCLSDFRSYYDAYMKEGTFPYDEIPELLMLLYTQGIVCGVLSNKYDPAAKALVQHFFGNTIDQTLGERPHVPRKPDPQGVFDLLAVWNANPAHTLYVGDSVTDIRTARNAGLYAVGVTWGFGSKEELADAGAHTLLDTPSELLTLLNPSAQLHER